MSGFIKHSALFHCLVEFQYLDFQLTTYILIGTMVGSQNVLMKCLLGFQYSALASKKTVRQFADRLQHRILLRSKLVLSHKLDHQLVVETSHQGAVTLHNVS